MNPDFFYHCVGRCWWVVIVFLYFLDVLVWVALLLAKVHGTEVKKREIYRTLDSHRSPCQVIFYKNLRQKTFTKQRFYHKATATTLRNTQQTPIHPHDNKNLGRNSDNQNN